MKKTMHSTGGAMKTAAVAGTALVLGIAGTAAPALALDAASTSGLDAAVATDGIESAGQDGIVRLATVEGTFWASQDVVTDAEQIARAFSVAPSVLCNSDFHAEEAQGLVGVDARDWEISVGGDVRSAFTVSLGAYADRHPLTQVLGCTCLGNPVDGRATANARVTGIDLRDLLISAAPDAGANAVTFVSADGYRQTLPLTYLLEHPAVIAYEVNGLPIHDVMGGTVQLWVGSASANYYVRDVVSIEVETVGEMPIAPGDESFEHAPNVTILSYEQI